MHLPTFGEAADAARIGSFVKSLIPPVFKRPSPEPPRPDGLAATMAVAEALYSRSYGTLIMLRAAAVERMPELVGAIDDCLTALREERAKLASL